MAEAQLQLVERAAVQKVAEAEAKVSQLKEGALAADEKHHTLMRQMLREQVAQGVVSSR